MAWLAGMQVYAYAYTAWGQKTCGRNGVGNRAAVAASSLAAVGGMQVDIGLAGGGSAAEVSRLAPSEKTFIQGHSRDRG